MNERYLFRGKRKDNGEWVTGYLIQGNNTYIVTPEAIYYMVVSISYMASVEFVEVIPETVGQCTGLKDKNGNWIFEGDIFKFDDEVWSSCYTSCGTEYDSYDVVNYGAIGFNKDSASYDFIKYKYNENSIEADLHENCNIEFADFVTELEVIGNKWDNPELLEVE